MAGDNRHRCAIAFAAFLASLAGEALPYTQDLTPNCASLGPPHPGASAPPFLPALPGQTVLATAQGFDLGPTFTAPQPNRTAYVSTAVPETRLEIVQAQVTQALQRTGHRVTIDEQAPPAPDPPRQYRAPRTPDRTQLHRPQPRNRRHQRPMRHRGVPRLHHPCLAPLPRPVSTKPNVYCSARPAPSGLRAPECWQLAARRNSAQSLGSGVGPGERGPIELAAERAASRPAGTVPAAARSRPESSRQAASGPGIGARSRGALMTERLDLALLVGAAVVLIGVAAVRLSLRLGLPSLLLYLGIGLALGESGLGLQFEDADLARTLGLAALVVILAEGGLTAHWSAVRPALPLAGLLATLGVAVTISVVAAAAWLVLGLDLRTALLYGGVVASTDAAAVFSTLRTIALPSGIVATLEAESGDERPDRRHRRRAAVEPGLGDALAAVHRGLGDLRGGGRRRGLVRDGRRRRGVSASGGLPASGLYPLATIAFAVLAYAGAASLHASGFLAVYLTALRLGNADLPHRPAVRAFAEGIAWLAQIGVFVMLGLLASPSRLPDAALPALAIGAVLLVLARPLAVLVCATPFRRPAREQLFLSWAGLRGAVPIILATVPLSAGLAGSQTLFDVVFVLVVVFTLLQAPLLAPLAKALGLIRPDQPVELTVESAPLETVHAELLAIAVIPGSRLNFIEVGELRLPELGAQVSLVVREGRTYVPDASFRLRTGDQLLVVVAPDARGATEDRLVAVGRAGRAAPWLPARATKRSRRRWPRRHPPAP